LVGWQEGHLACKNEWWGAGVVICLGSGKICIWPSRCHCHSLFVAPVNPDLFYLPGFTFMILAHPGNPGQSPGGCKTVVVVGVVDTISEIITD